MADCLIGIGSNLGDRAAILDRATALFCGHAQVQLLAHSTYHATRPVGGPGGQPVFLNGVLRIMTSLDPKALLAWAHSVEDQMGRQRTRPWAARNVDIDLLLYDRQVLKSAECVVPHPRMIVRRFVLEPAQEIAADMVHAPTNWTIAQLLDHLNQASPYIALAGAFFSGRTVLAGVIDQRRDTHVLREPDPSDWDIWKHEQPDARWAAQWACVARRRECLTRLSDLLRGRSSKYVVSDFWLGQWPMAACQCYDQVDCEQPAELDRLRQWRQRVAGSPSPMLIFFLDVPLDKLADRCVDAYRQCDRSTACRWLRDYSERLRQQLDTPGHGPVLRVTGDVHSASTELAAALDAMYPMR